MLNYTDYFSATYARARKKFRNAVIGASGTLTSYTLPDVVGAEGEVLSVDAGYIGAPAASRLLIMISGTHGLEGFAGSALQIAFLQQLAGTGLGDDLGVLLVHALNAYGFSHGSRTTTNGVDLNRNFVDHTIAPTIHERYAELHPYLLPQWWDANCRQACDMGIAQFRLRYGDDVYFDTFASGQYHYPAGACFGGFSREWENVTLQRIVTPHAGLAKKVAVIDWHTGIGEYGKPFPMIFAAPESDAYQQTSSWWGRVSELDPRPHGRRQPTYRGLVFQGLESFLPNAALAGGVIEIGTRGPVAGDLAIRQDLWLRQYGHTLSEDARRQLHADLLDSLNPVSYQWREQVLIQGLPLIDATLDGLARWQDLTSIQGVTP